MIWFPEKNQIIILISGETDEMNQLAVSAVHFTQLLSALLALAMH